MSRVSRPRRSRGDRPTGWRAARWSAPTERAARWSAPTIAIAFTLALGLLFPAFAAFYPSAKTGPSGDAMGKQTRDDITAAIAEASALSATLSSSDAKDWPDGLAAYRGTQAATDARAAVTEVQEAFESLRDDWDRLSVETVSLKKGWNAFYVYVEDSSPSAVVVKPLEYPARLRARVAEDFANPADAAVAALLDEIASLAQKLVDTRLKIIGSYASCWTDWPVEDVFIHLGSTETAKQFVKSALDEASGSSPYLTWSAAAPDALNTVSLPAGRVYTAFSTGETSRTVALLGRNVRAGSMTWHRTGGSDNPAEWNFLGVAIPGKNARKSAEDVMQDLDFTSTYVAKLSGTDAAEPSFTTTAGGAGLTVGDAEVLIANATATSSWYPAPTARPSDGLTISAGKTEVTFTLENDTAVAQVVTGTLHRTGILKTALLGITGIEIRATSQSSEWTRWNFSETSTTNLYFTAELAAGESRTYTVHFDRTAFDIAARENGYSDDFRRTFSAVMRFRYAANPACTYLGLVAAPNNDAVTTIWPAGLWIGTMSFDKVSQVKGNQTIVHNVPAKGTMMVRALLHVSADGECKLLHHVVTESVTCSNAVDGTFVQTTLYAGRAKPEGDGTVKRYDSIAMDIDNPIVTGTGDFTNGLSFAWTMAPEGRGNPFHHPYHPSHDGLQWDFKTPAPSGDDMNNYRQGEVKPETWSIENKVTLTIDNVDFASLPDTVTGTCTWELGNMRRKVNGENIRAAGTISLTRMETVGKLIEE